MPRGARLAFEGSFLHVFNRGINKEPIFTRPKDYDFFLTKLLDLRKKYDHSLYAVVLMPNHFHLSIQTRKSPISKILSSLTTSYAMYFNRSYQHFGPVFQNRFKSILIENDDYFVELSRYVYLNPFKANLCQDPLVYSYSSFREAVGKEPLKLLDSDIVRLVGDTKGSQKEYERYILDGMDEDQSPLSTLFEKEESVFGSDYFNVRSHRKYARRRA